MQYRSGMNQLVDYFDQLKQAADHADVDLLQAFKDAGVPTSTYYRARQGQGLHRDTAQKVMDVLHHHGRSAA
jgi:predicted transcriptional regulator